MLKSCFVMQKTDHNSHHDFDQFSMLIAIFLQPIILGALINVTLFPPLDGELIKLVEENFSPISPFGKGGGGALVRVQET